MNDIPARPKNVRATSKNLAETGETPSAAFMGQNKKSVDVTDASGRQLKIKFLGTLDRMRIAKMLGGELAKNEVYLGYATLAYAVTEIDGEGVPPPVAVREVEFLVDRLGDDGLNAVGKAYQEHFADMLKGLNVDDAKN